MAFLLAVVFEVGGEITHPVAWVLGDDLFLDRLLETHIQGLADVVGLMGRVSVLLDQPQNCGAVDILKVSVAAGILKHGREQAIASAPGRYAERVPGLALAVEIEQPFEGLAQALRLTPATGAK